jgi:hypothetical protein
MPPNLVHSQLRGAHPPGPASRARLFRWPDRVRDAMFLGPAGAARWESFIAVVGSAVAVTSDYSGLDIQGEALRLMWEVRLA